MYGVINKIFLASSSREEVSQMGTSGGFIKSLLCYMIDKGYKAVITRMNGMKPETIIAENYQEILTDKTNSCYIENPEWFNILDKIKDEPLCVAVGLPCQIKAIDRDDVFKIALLCNHEPKKEYTEWICKLNGVEDPQTIIYRNKNGMTEINGCEYPFIWSEEFMPDKCKRCSLTGDEADIVCCDPHGLNVKNKTLVISRNQQATNIIKDAYSVMANEISIDILELSQGNHFRRKKQC